MIKKLLLTSSLMIAAFGLLQAQQGFFLDSWGPKIAVVPDYQDTVPTSEPPTVSIIVHARDTLSNVPVCMFGDNVNAYTTSMSENKTLMKYLSDRNMGVLRGPSGSISDVYFWNRSQYQPPTDVPETLLAGGSDPGWEWYGKRPNSWDAGWTMDIDSFYSILAQTGVTGMLTVNYGYARYGTADNPVAQAAHLAADWVRYDNGRTKFWEIGNEVFGSWEAGYRIDQSLNKDGQPEYINGTLYGQHCKVFIDSMKAAALERGVEIFIGAVASESSGSGPSGWNVDLMKEVGDVIDFYIVHSYFTPYNQNSNVNTILNSPSQTQGYMNYLNSCVTQAGKSMRPAALTEYNIFAIGSKQQVSQIGGMFAVMVTGEAIKAGLGAICRWDLANGYSSGDDHGMYSYGDEPGVSRFSPRPAFYYLYYMQKYLGDVLLNTSFKGSSDITAYSSSFYSGHISTIVVNKGLKNRVVRINLDSVTVGNRYYTYTLVGGTDVPTDPLMPFSRKVIVNGNGPAGVAGGPLNYEFIKAKSSVIGNEILIEAPPLSVTYLLVDSGDRQLEVNNILYPAVTWSTPADIVYGTLLSSTQLNATCSLPGIYTYDPPLATLLNSGTGIELKVTFVPNDTSVFSPVTKTVNINVNKATPVITWDPPAAIVHGTVLGDAQLNAGSNVDGTFNYDPPAGTLLGVGPDQILKTTFAPSDTMNYDTASKSVNISVSAVVGTHDLSENEISIHPVPVSDQLILSGFSTLENTRIILLQIVSGDGVVVRNINLENTGNSNSVDVSNLPAGIYLVQLFTADKSIIKRFIKR
jgi:hypothetical protein